MVKENIIFDKSKDLAVRIINLYRYLKEVKKETVLSKQILRSGTSIGANLAEATFGFSKKDFLSKSFISLKECSETIYWLELLVKTDYISEQQFNSLNEDCLQILKMLIASVKTIQKNLNN